MTKDYKILIADDHSVIRQGISLILKQIGFDSQVDHVNSFPSMINQIKSNSYELIVLDISIPEGRGVQMIELIRQYIPEVKILIFSAHPEEL